MMKTFLHHLRSYILAGILFLIPVFVILTIIQKLWAGLTNAGSFLVKTFGLASLLGNKSVPVVTALLLVLLFYFAGWLVRFSMLTRMKDWIENTVLQYIPGYLTYKAQMQEKIKPSEDSRIPVWIETVDGKRPGFLIEEFQYESIVFFPNSPDSNNGEIILIEKNKVKKMNIKAVAFIKTIQQFGKGLTASH